MTYLFVIVSFLFQSFYQSNGQVTLNEKNRPLQEVLSKLRKQTDYSFSIDTDALKHALPVTVHIQNGSLQDALKQIFDNQPYTYEIKGKRVHIYPKPHAGPTEKPIAQVPAQGYVRDINGNPIEGATVRVKGSPITTVTDPQGYFLIIQVANNAKLSISHIAYDHTEVVVSKEMMTINLKLLPSELEEVQVINTGYQSIPRERTTGSYAIIDAEKLKNKLQPDVLTAIEGMASGLVVTREGNIEVRGTSTFNSEKSPLIVVDGYPISGGLESLNIDNIEHITVLKDAVAASIYGARSSNGVIVVTTKQAKDGAFRFEYKPTVSVELKPLLKYLNRSSSSDYIDAELDLYRQSPNTYLNSYNNYRYLSYVNYLKVAESQDLVTEAFVNEELNKLRQHDGLGQIEEYLFRDQWRHQHHIQLSGGQENNITSAGLRYVETQGQTVGSNDNRLIFDLKNDWKLNRFLSLQLLSNINYSRSSAPLRTPTSILEYHSNTTFQPYDLLVDPISGTSINQYAVNPKRVARYAGITGMQPMHLNLLEDLPLEMNRSNNFQMRIGGTFRVKVNDDINAQIGGLWSRGNILSRSLSDRNSFTMRSIYNDNTSISKQGVHYIPYGDRLDESRLSSENYVLRGQLNYNKSVAAHQIIALLGGEISRDVVDNSIAPTRFGYDDLSGTFSPFNYADYNAGVYNADMYGGPTTAGFGAYQYRDNRFVSAYANGSYEYDNRFLFSGSIRLDQTNFFGTNPDYRYRPLWSVGGTYKLSNEKFFNTNLFSKLYIRASHGINGNISLDSGPFLVIAPGTYNNLTGNISYNISSPPNNALRWEKTVTSNVGVDFSLLANRVNMTVDYYSRISKDLLAPDLVDPTLGYTNLTRNVGQINNDGLEVSLDAQLIKGEVFQWNAFGTFSYNRNKVVEYNVNYQYASSLMTSVNRVDYPANALFSYRNAGLDNAGNALFFDQDGEKQNGANIQVDDLVYSGTLRAPFTYSLTNSFRYSDFELAFMLVARTGNVLRRPTYDGSKIQHKDVSKRWREPGDEEHTVYPVLSPFSFDFFYFPYSDIFVESGNFLKMRDASLAYHFKPNALNKLKISRATLMFQARNVFMIAKNSQGIDPEAIELINPASTQAELGFTPFRPRPEFYLSLNIGF